jgi:hypothetical protein
MSDSPKSSKKPKQPSGFAIYRDKKGRFISKAAWQGLKKSQRKAANVIVQRDAKGRFVSEKFVSVKVKIEPEKNKKKKVKRKLKRKLEVCDFSKVFELVNQDQITKLNVTGIQNLSLSCLSQLIENQIKRGAYLFRFWYKGNAYHRDTEEGTTRSTHLINARRLQEEFVSVQKFLNHLGGPVIYYWMDLYETKH